jgi:hypothetical protein
LREEHYAILNLIELLKAGASPPQFTAVIAVHQDETEKGRAGGGTGVVGTPFVIASPELVLSIMLLV